MKCFSKSLLSASNPCWVIWVDNEYSGLQLQLLLSGSMFCFPDSLVLPNQRNASFASHPYLMNTHQISWISTGLCFRFRRKLGFDHHVTLTDRISERSSPARALDIYACMIYPRKCILKERVGLEKIKMPYLRAKIALGAVQPDLMSAASQRISRGVISVWINECFLHITGQQGTFGPGKGINHHHKCRFSSPSHCVYVQTVSFQRILCRTSSNTNTGSLHGEYCSLLLPMTFPFLPLATTVLPSWLRAALTLINEGECVA